MGYIRSEGHLRGTGNPNLDAKIKDGNGFVAVLYIDEATTPVTTYIFDSSKPSGAKWIIESASVNIPQNIWLSQTSTTVQSIKGNPIKPFLTLRSAIAQVLNPSTAGSTVIDSVLAMTGFFQNHQYQFLDNINLYPGKYLLSNAEYTSTLTDTRKSFLLNLDAGATLEVGDAVNVLELFKDFCVISGRGTIAKKGNTLFKKKASGSSTNIELSLDSIYFEGVNGVSEPYLIDIKALTTALSVNINKLFLNSANLLDPSVTLNQAEYINIGHLNTGRNSVINSYLVKPTNVASNSNTLGKKITTVAVNHISCFQGNEATLGLVYLSSVVYNFNRLNIDIKTFSHHSSLAATLINYMGTTTILSSNIKTNIEFYATSLNKLLNISEATVDGSIDMHISKYANPAVNYPTLVTITNSNIISTGSIKLSGEYRGKILITLGQDGVDETEYNLINIFLEGTYYVDENFIEITGNEASSIVIHLDNTKIITESGTGKLVSLLGGNALEDITLVCNNVVTNSTEILDPLITVIGDITQNASYK